MPPYFLMYLFWPIQLKNLYISLKLFKINDKRFQNYLFSSIFVLFTIIRSLLLYCNNQMLKPYHTDCIYIDYIDNRFYSNPCLIHCIYIALLHYVSSYVLSELLRNASILTLFILITIIITI